MSVLPREPEEYETFEATVVTESKTEQIWKYAPKELIFSLLLNIVL